MSGSLANLAIAGTFGPMFETSCIALRVRPKRGAAKRHAGFNPKAHQERAPETTPKLQDLGPYSTAKAAGLGHLMGPTCNVRQPISHLAFDHAESSEHAIPT